MSGGSSVLGLLAARLSRLRGSSLLPSVAGLGGLTVAETVLGLAVALILARELGVEGLGAYSIAIAAAGLAAIPVEFGLPALVTREIAHFGVGSDGCAEKGILIFAATVVGATSALLAGVALLAALTGGMAEGLRSFGPPLAILIPLTAVARVCGAALAGRGHVAVGAMPAQLIRPAVFVTLLGALALAEPGWLTPVRAVWLQTAAAALAMATGTGLFLARFAGILRGSRARISWLRWAAAVLRLGVVRGIFGTELQVLLLLTGALAGVGEVGLLRVAQRGAGVVAAAMQIVITAAAPRIARLHSEGRPGQLQGLLRRLAQAAFAVAAAGLLGVVVAGHWLIGVLFGPAFLPAWGPLIVLTAAFALAMLFGPGGLLLTMLRREDATMRGVVISLLLSLAAAAALTVSLGALGAAIGRSAGRVGMAIYMWHRARRDLGYDTAVSPGLARLG